MAMECSDIDLTGHVALVTGGGGGIGRGIALCLAEFGADLSIIDVIPERCAEACARVTERGRTALPVQADVMNTDSIFSAVEATKERFGRLDILVNNAGGVTHRYFQDMKERNWRRHIDLNLVSVLAATAAALPVMTAGGQGGSIINVTSIEASRAAPGYAVYAACKAGVNNLTKTLAIELSEHGIRVNAIAPDYILTPGLRGNTAGPVDESTWVQLSAGQLESVRRRIPLKRPGADLECGMVAVFLASQMACYVTGAIIPVDGGTWASGGWVRDGENGWVLPPQIAE
jgi:NAD(P)-dependent dehydrogenase (short-subunit alcohol dehydrogenase family)